MDILHLAIPCLSLEDAVAFYGEILRCRQARRYPDRVTFEFFGAQLVCHLAQPDQIDAEPQMYPRHFGLTVEKESDFEDLHQRLLSENAPFFAPLFVRFPERREEHRTFFLKDPANNLVEFKWYRDPEMRF